MSSKIIAKYTKHISNMRLEDHIIFICPECAEELQTQQEWRRHLNETHNYKNKSVQDFNFKEIDESYHECQTCFKLVANANQTIVLLQYHYFLHLPFNRTYRCRHCMVTFRRKRALVVHLCRIHSNQVGVIPNPEIPNDIDYGYGIQGNPDFYIRFICPQCGMSFVRQDTWKEHLKLSHVSTYTELRMHKISVTNNHYCLDCKKIFHTSDREKLQRHHFTHLPNKMYMQCAYCPYKRPYKSEILRHFIYVHTKEFLATKLFIQKPDEFGAKINARLDFELGVLLSKEDENDEHWEKRPQSDLIKRALMNTFMDNDGQTKPNSGINSLRNLDEERVLADSLRDLEAFISEDSHIDRKASITHLSDYNSDELEELCDEMFEPIYNIKDEQITLQSPRSKRCKYEESIVSRSSNQKCDLKSALEMYTLYLCPQCGIQFNQQQSWREHVFEAHDLSNIVETKFKIQNDKQSYLCLQCNEVQFTKKQSELQRHYFNHMPYHSYLKCTLCNKTKSSKPKFMQHLKEQHTDLIKQPITPLPKVSSRSEILRHLERTQAVALRLNKMTEKYGWTC